MSLRNNSERLGAHPTSEAPAPAFAENQFSFVLPTMFVELPSKGEFYLEGHPLHGLDAVEIRMMTAKDEDLLTNPDLIKKIRLVTNIKGFKTGVNENHRHLLGLRITLLYHIYTFNQATIYPLITQPQPCQKVSKTCIRDFCFRNSGREIFA